jgi:threonine/homoserine/homoserine lactone efflux protein
MIISYFVGIIIGLIFSLPPGPVVIATVKVGINNGFKESIYIAYGTALIDFCYSTISVISSVIILNVLQGFIKDNNIVYKILQLLFVLVLTGYGLKMVLYKSDEEESEVKNYKQISRKSSFILGFGISLSNILNPMFFSSMLMVGYFAQKFALPNNDIFEKLFFGMGFGSGTLLWLFTVNIIIQFLKSKTSKRIILLIHRIAGACLMLSGVLTFYKIL